MHLWLFFISILTVTGLAATGLKNIKHPLCKYLLSESEWPDPPLPSWPIPLQNAPNPKYITL